MKTTSSFLKYVCERAANVPKIALATKLIVLTYALATSVCSMSSSIGYARSAVTAYKRQKTRFELEVRYAEMALEKAMLRLKNFKSTVQLPHIVDALLQGLRVMVTLDDKEYLCSTYNDLEMVVEDCVSIGRHITRVDGEVVVDLDEMVLDELCSQNGASDFCDLEPLRERAATLPVNCDHFKDAVVVSIFVLQRITP